MGSTSAPERPASPHPVRTAEVVLPCPDTDGLDATLGFFIDRLGFRIESIMPADQPARAVLSGHGVRICLRRDMPASPGGLAPGVLQLSCRDPDAIAGGARELVAPNGTRILLVQADPPVQLPPACPSLVVCRLDQEASWHTGRAGMRYRDLIPGRQGGRFIGSHIVIPDGGPVPDYVHFHKIHFQMIYGYRGWSRLVYEDQGPPFLLQAGDCVLQPPGIRHRVLESSARHEVIELGCPAEHETHADHDMSLPTAEVRPDRQFAGQRFVRHQAASAVWQPGPVVGFEMRDLGIAEATEGLAGVRVFRPGGSRAGEAEPGESGSGESLGVSMGRFDGDFLFCFVLEGALDLQIQGHDARPLAAGDSFTLPRGVPYRLAGWTPELEILQVALPGVA